VAVELRLEGVPGLEARLFRELIGRCRKPTTRIGEPRAEIPDLVTRRSPVLAVHGCGALSAAKIIGETAGIQRFRSKDALVRHNGTAPIPVWPASQVRHRLNRAGSRQLNAALHRIALTQARHDPNFRVYFDRLRAAGNTTTEAIRYLKRRLSDAVYRARLADEPAPGSATRLLVA
jgi:transposase